MEHTYIDPDLLETLKTVDVPRILTARTDGTVVYVALGDDGDSLIEVEAD